MSFPKPFYRWRPHPWHGLSVGPNPPELVHAYIEITPFDAVKYEIDKETGYLRVDRPQRTSSQPPTLYGFVPKTFCGPRVCDLSPHAQVGDQDPLDICVLSERPITRAEVILNCIPIGGLQMIDGGEADDKIIAVLSNDPIWGDVRTIAEIPQTLVERLRHYFLTYKLRPGEPKSTEIYKVFQAEHAHKVIAAAMEDYVEQYGG
ncbi:MAG: inorganic pyrophosphatase [Deltaproteobacteria bacterium]|nr:inorganic pyrophosphatase [Deltaproteobacteria bacterium]